MGAGTHRHVRSVRCAFVHQLDCPPALHAAGVLSYVIARPLMTAVSVVANIAGVYGEGEFRRDRSAEPYVLRAQLIWQTGVGNTVGVE